MKRIARTIRSHALPLAAALATGAAAAAPVAAADHNSNVWTYQITPYVWASGLGGDITPFTGAPTVAISKSFSDVLEDLDAAFFISGFARRDRFVLLGDLSYSSSSKAGLAAGIPAEGKLTQTSLTVAGGYRVVSEPNVSLDVLGGARLWRLKASVASPAPVPQGSVSKTFVDPIVAVRANFALAPRWSAIVYADVGGFGVGSRSTSQFVGTINYQLRDNVYLSGGYRVLNVDYRSGGTRVDATMSGPLFGATWRF